MLHAGASSQTPQLLVGQVSCGAGEVDEPDHVMVVLATMSAFFPVEQSFDVIVGAGGLVVDFETEAAASLAARGGIAFVASTWELELVPDPDFPCEIESYGETCGAMLSATTDFDHPGELVVALEDPSMPDVAALTLGSTRASTPIIGTGCTLYHNLQVFLFPWSVDSSGRAEVSFVVPPIPGLSFKMQAAALKGTTIHATNALDALVCH